MLPDDPKLLTTGQVAKLCAVTPDTILKWIKKGRLHGVRTAGGHFRIERRDVEPLLATARNLSRDPCHGSEGDPRSLRCWEYLSHRGTLREDCRECVAYRVGAARCFMLAGLDADVGHARQFCGTSCDECVYYRRVNGLATHVLAITSDEELAARLANEESERIEYRIARNAYEASAIIQGFRPAFAVVDGEGLAPGRSELLDSLTSDARVPGLRVIIAVPARTAARKRRWVEHESVVGVVEKSFDTSEIAELIADLPIGSPPVENGPL